MSAPQSTPGSGRSGSGSAQPPWDISELDAADRELSNLVEVETQRVLSWRFVVTVAIVAITCFSNWNSMLMTPRILSSNPFRANGSTLQRREEKKKKFPSHRKTCLYRGERIGFGLGRCQFRLPRERSLKQEG